MNSSDVQPSIWYYGLSILIIIVGFIAFAGFIFTSVSDMGESLMQVVVPGSADLDLEEPGEYTIFYENQTYFNGKFYSTGEQISGLQIQVSGDCYRQLFDYIFRSRKLHLRPWKSQW